MKNTRTRDLRINKDEQAKAIKKGVPAGMM